MKTFFFLATAAAALGATFTSSVGAATLSARQTPHFEDETEGDDAGRHFLLDEEDTGDGESQRVILDEEETDGESQHRLRLFDEEGEEEELRILPDDGEDDGDSQRQVLEEDDSTDSNRLHSHASHASSSPATLDDSDEGEEK